MNNRNLLIGAGVVIVGYLLYKNIKRNTPPSAKQMKCEQEYSQLLQPAVEMPQEYWNKRKEDWMKANCK
jgi:hypothetical protein